MPGAVRNRTYRVWGNTELPKYFIKLHLTASARSRKPALAAFAKQGIR